jgi:S-adenosylmethionine:tRNA ribosyltransferase-isomerase
VYALQTSSLRNATAPPERRGIARDEVKMLVTDRASGMNYHRSFVDLPAVLRPGDLIVVNDSATIPAALTAERENGERLQLHVATKIDERIWMMEPRDSVLCGEELRLPAGGSVVTIAPVDPEQPRLWYGWFQLPQPMYTYLAEHGMPIHYSYVTEEFPLSEYQTIFAREPGSSEMPSAARPFSARVLHEIHRRGIEIATITLHCGVASFEEPERPPSERFRVPFETAEAVNRARAQRSRVIAVGSTVLRALESSREKNLVIASSGWTDLVIGEGYELQTVDGLLTGFHDRAATHQSILRAVLGRGLLATAYDEAAYEGYYQHEFGDVHLIL